jgi:hypothetical protein
MGDLSRVQTSIPVQLVDANDLQVVDITTSTPSGTEAGVVVRNIPSGTQTVAGTVTASPSGTYTVAGGGSAGTAAAGVVTIQGITSGVSVAVALDNSSYKSKGTNTFTTSAPNGTATSIIGSNANRASLLIYNAGSATVYLGKSGSVTTGNGVPLLPNASIEDTESTDSWYGITGGTTGDLRVIETAI